MYLHQERLKPNIKKTMMYKNGAKLIKRISIIVKFTEGQTTNNVLPLSP